MNKLVLMFMIFDPKFEKEYIKILDKFNVKFKIISYGKGTASSSLLEYFGLNEIKRKIILSIMPYNMSKYILKLFEEEYEIDKPGNGIAFTIMLSSSIKYIRDIYEKDMEDIMLDDANKHLIVTIANEGNAENIMNAAKKLGVTGGTALSGRSLNTEKAVKFLGISIEPEKDIVFILVDEDKKNDIMNSIVDKCGLKTKGAGICFSLPVAHVAGLKDIKE